MLSILPSTGSLLSGDAGTSSFGGDSLSDDCSFSGDDSWSEGMLLALSAPSGTSLSADPFLSKSGDAEPSFTGDGDRSPSDKAVFSFLI